MLLLLCLHCASCRILSSCTRDQIWGPAMKARSLCSWTQGSPTFIILFLNLFLIGILLLYSVVLVSAIRQRESARGIHMFLPREAPSTSVPIPPLRVVLERLISFPVLCCPCSPFLSVRCSGPKQNAGCSPALTALSRALFILQNWDSLLSTNAQLLPPSPSQPPSRFCL